MLATLGQDEIVRVRLPVVEEVVLDGSGPEAQTENELVVSEVGVVAHDMPEHRTVPDRHHRLRRGVFAGPHAQAQASAEDHDLHVMYPLAPPDGQNTSNEGSGTTSRPPQSRTYTSCSEISSLRFHGRTST